MTMVLTDIQMMTFVESADSQQHNTQIFPLQIVFIADSCLSLVNCFWVLDTSHRRHMPGEHSSPVPASSSSLIPADA